MNFNKDQIAAFSKLFSSALLSGNRGSLESKEISIDHDSFGYQIYLPSKLKDKHDWPLIVFLHGITQRGTDGFLPSDGTYGTFLRQYLAQIPAIILFPQCRPGCYWSDPVMDEMVMEQISQTIREYGVEEKRLYLIGVSMGGYGLWHFAFRYPKKFAALVSICGGSSLITGDRFNPLAEKIGKTPAWLFHGADDKIVQVSESRQIVKAIEAHQGEVKYSEYPNVGHNVWFNALAEKNLIPWLLAQENNDEQIQQYYFAGKLAKAYENEKGIKNSRHSSLLKGAAAGLVAGPVVSWVKSKVELPLQKLGEGVFRRLRLKNLFAALIRQGIS